MMACFQLDAALLPGEISEITFCAQHWRPVGVRVSSQAFR